MRKYKAEILALHKLRGKMFETWKRLRVIICIVKGVQRQTNIYVSSTHLVVLGLSLRETDSLCCRGKMFNKRVCTYLATGAGATV
jgi:hypothetical protein